MRRVNYILCSLIVLVSIGMCTAAWAGPSNSIGYAVRAVLPRNQLDNGATYFDLNVVPDQEQVLQVIVLNREDEEIQVAVEANTAFSNANGVIEFSYSQERDASMKVDFSAIVTPVEQVVTVPANGQTVAEFILTVPEEPFEGVVYGGLMFTKLNQETCKQAGSVSIQNIYRYVIGVRLHESDAIVEPAFELISAEMNQTNNQTIQINLRNPQAVIAYGIELHVRIYPEGGNEPAFTYENHDIAMAPNSSMPFSIRLGNEQSLNAGMYRMTVELQYEDDSWAFETPLAID